MTMTILAGSEGETVANFGSWMRKARDKADLTLEELAVMLETTHPTLSRYENDKSNPKRETVKRIAEVLNADESEGLIAAGYVPSGREIVFVADPDEVRMLSSFRGVSSRGKRVASDMIEAMRRAEHEESLGGSSAINGDNESL